MDNSNGRRWARFWLITALIVSVVANVTHTVLADSDITLWLRVPGAVVWPVFTFAGIEILVRVQWQRRWTHVLARGVLLASAIPAAVTSYEHQHALLLKMGENEFIAVIGPLAIDGLMIGCTMTLLFTRALIAPTHEHSEQQAMSDEQLEQVVSRWVSDERSEQSDAPVSPAPMLTLVSSEQSERAPRATNERTEQQLRELLSTPELKAVSSTMRRYAKIARLLRDAPGAEVDYSAEKVKRELVENVIRPWAQQERVR